MGAADRRGPFGAWLRARRSFLASGTLASFYLMGAIAVATLPLLVRDAPLLLAFLNPTTWVLLLVSARIDPVPFIVLGTLRRFASHILFFLLGEWHGARAVGWVEGRGGRASRVVRLIERLFARVRPLVVFLWPGPLPSVLAGASRMPRPRFAAIDLAGTLVAVLIVRVAALTASDPLDVIVRFIDRHAVPLTALCAAATAGWFLVRWLRARGAGAAPHHEAPVGRVQSAQD